MSTILLAACLYLAISLASLAYLHSEMKKAPLVGPMYDPEDQLRILEARDLARKQRIRDRLSWNYCETWI